MIRNDVDDPALLAAASSGDEAAFRDLIEAYKRELHVHCYRLLGSIQDAEDAWQETSLRAWRYLGTFERRSSFRAWLYRIATNVCLTQRSRAAPPIVQIALPPEALASSGEPDVNITPYPDSLLEELPATSGDPAAEYDLHESVQLAFLAAVQVLPPRQRAVLILRDVVGWSASEVAGLLDSTTAGVNSALQRAHVSIEQQRKNGRLNTTQRAIASEVEQLAVDRYVDAWYARDFDRLASVLKSDAVLTMPPWPVRFQGRDAIARFFSAILASVPRADSYLRRTRANGQPALVSYRLDRESGLFHGVGVSVLTLDGDAIAETTGFNDPGLLPWFGAALELDPSEVEMP